jgi:dynactin 1
MEDREVKEKLEQALSERDKYQAVIEKLQTKYRPQQQELEKLKRALAEYEERFVAIEDLQQQHELDMEGVIMDRELAQEESANHKLEMEALREKNEELVLELEILKEENSEYTKEMTSEERSSTGYLQLVRTNERLKDALIRLRDITQDKEAELKDQIGGLQDRVKEADEVKSQYEDTRERLLRSQSDTENLRQQLEAAQGAEEMIETLAEKNDALQNKLNELRAAIDDLESLREINDELELNHVETEKQLQDELDFKDSLLLDRERTAKEQQAALDEADYNINRFRELVTQLQGDLQDLEASKQISQTEAEQLSNKSRAVMDLNSKLQSSAAKTQVKTIDLELRKLDAEQASQHLEIVQLFLPDTFKTDRDSVLALLRFRRIAFKASLVQSFVKERIASFGTRGQDEEVFAACDAMDKLTWIAGMSERLVNSISSCTPDAFAQYGSALFELEVVERSLNDYVDALRRDELRESDMTVRLGRSIEVMTHLSSLHLREGLAEHADELIMKTMLLQSQLESATSAFTVAKSLLEGHLSTVAEEDDSEDDEAASDNAQLLSRLKSIIEQVRNAKVVSMKTHRALVDLKASSLTLESSVSGNFEGAAAIASSVAAYACRSGNSLQEFFGEEGRLEPFSTSEVASILSRLATDVFSVTGAEAGPYATLNSQLRELSTLLINLSALPTDLDNTVEFERTPEPWVARSEELKRTKITSVDTEAELARALESVRERDVLAKQKEKELEIQAISIETLEARMRAAGKQTAKIAELERALREAKENETKARKDVSLARHEAQQDIDRVRNEMARLADERAKSGKSVQIDSDAMGAGTKSRMKRAEWKAAGMESAIRFLSEDNIRLRHPAPDAPASIAKTHAWIFEPLVPPVKAYREKQSPVAGSKIIEQMLELATMPSPVDLTTIPDNKLAWRPAKETSRWKVERRKEQWLDWKAWAESVVAPQPREVKRDAQARMVAV